MYILARPTGEPGIAWAASLLASRSAANYNGSLGRWWRRTFVYDDTAHTSARSTFDLQITWVNIINGPANPMRMRARNVQRKYCNNNSNKRAIHNWKSTWSVHNFGLLIQLAVIGNAAAGLQFLVWVSITVTRHRHPMRQAQLHELFPVLHSPVSIRRSRLHHRLLNSRCVLNSRN